MRTCLSLKTIGEVTQMLKRIINLGAIYYAAITGVLLIFACIFGGDTAILEPSKFLFIMLFSFVASTGTAIKEYQLMGHVADGICHAICYIGGFFFCLILPYGKGFTFAVIMLALFSAGYGALCLLKSAIRKNTKGTRSKAPDKNTSKAKGKTKSSNTASKKAKKETEYKSLFSNKDN